MSEWRLIPFMPVYEVSNEGIVRRVIGRTNTFPGRVLKPHKSNGYWRVTLYMNGTHQKHNINRLVLIAFRGPPPTPEHESAHGDGDRSNDRLDNLRWATKKENAEDCIKHGTKCCRENHPHAKLTSADVVAILSRYTGKRGELRAMASEFGVSRPAITNIVRRKRWKSIP